ncbi:DUF1801 domain-containing protein [bacterium]|nr:DUF1801 domain-containing protein [bacterium]
MSPKAAPDPEAAQRITERIEALADWRGAMLAHVRTLIHAALPDVIEDWKWRGVPVWYHNGMVCTGETYKATVKLTFAKGAALDDPAHLFNSSLDGNTRRAIDLHEGDTIDGPAFQALIRQAAAQNARPGARK